MGNWEEQDVVTGENCEGDFRERWAFSIFGIFPRVLCAGRHALSSTLPHRRLLWHGCRCLPGVIRVHLMCPLTRAPSNWD